MVDREKVVANVTGIVSDMQEEVDEWKDYSDSELSHGLTCDCDWWYKTLQTLKDALTLLKEQEAVKPVPAIEDVGDWLCGKCYNSVVGTEELDEGGFTPIRFNYCPNCGQAVKWNG